MDLRIENLSKRFAQGLAVEIPALTIRQGEFFTFVGPSGCGKTTTLNLIAGLEEPTSGTLWLGERRLDQRPPHQRDVAFVFQTYALYPHRSVAENLSFPLELAGVDRATRRRRVEDIAALLGLEALLEKRPAQLSGGERQRVALGRAIVRQPQLFLLDEPLSNLDAPLRAQMRKELKRLHRQLGTTFIYVTHDQEEALSLSDRIAVMRGGHIRQCGSPREVYEQPADTFVASFFGSPPINLLEARLVTEAGSVWAQLGESVRIRLSAPVEPANTENLIVGIRPEHLQLSHESLRGGFRLEVALVEPHGGQVYLELEGGGFRLTAVVRSETAFQLGDKVWAVVAAERLRLFDAVSGGRVSASNAKPF